ncbi:hypothetical protein FN976_15880 [Caenimonas sedimenti]|uniref:Big-1 domain-containing protein n=1 Tax=Caenimonas sedimenti TaxID=2596921 RepID=A0A562ZQ19_9BURK|nr:Ig-like domain-containing protein [Caenimonas sedimenti]TWO70456.1 hypothetical protein FN976_15880 [Caenimonas sedimenti]
MIRKLKFLGGLLLAAALAACGGGGGSPGTNPGGGGGSTTTPVAANLEVFTSSPELSSGATGSLSFTVVAKDANNQAIPGQTVTFSSSSGSLIGALPVPKTGAAGEPITSVSLTPGSDRTNRTITVTVTAGNTSRQVVIPVTGTTLTLSGDTSLLLGSTAQITVRALDSTGAPIPNSSVALRSSTGNTITPASATTNSQGVATFTLTAAAAGTDTLTATGMGASGTSVISVSPDAFRFSALASGSTIPVGTTQTVTVELRRNGSAAAGQAVTFSTTRGVITPLSAVTDSQGRASAVVSSNSAGPANIIAQVPTAQASLAVTYQATQASSLVLQANPGAIAPNTSANSAIQSVLVATVRDPIGNPVAGQVVNFTLLVDGSNGVLSPASAVTNANGIAQTAFIPGGLTTANNGVQIEATVAGTSVSGRANVTVNAQALFISIATSNTITNLNEQTYEKAFSVYVTDANGTPASSRIVNLEVLPLYYMTGSYDVDIVIDVGGFPRPTGPWRKTETGRCINEDLDRDGVLDVGEDENGNGRLDPGLPVVVTPASVTTDANGFATFKLQYGENYSTWVNTMITARAFVGGTESVKRQEYLLGASLADMTSAATPANQTSPFGAFAPSFCTPP